jgi:hypothetical protein
MFGASCIVGGDPCLRHHRHNRLYWFNKLASGGSLIAKKDGVAVRPVADTPSYLGIVAAFLDMIMPWRSRRWI